MSKYIIALDQGTTSSRAVLFNEKGACISIKSKEFEQIFPKQAWVEHNPKEIWESQQQVLNELLELPEVQEGEVLAIGITNQRETTVLWDRVTGEPIYNALVWQDKRTASICEELRKQGLTDYCKENTGLVLDSYFSGTKIKWILDHVDGARKRAENGDLCFGTIDSWLLWNLTNGKVHATDYSNASRTLIFNIRELQWDDTMLDALQIPKAILPEVKDSASHFGVYQSKHGAIPITAMIGDQQAALFGQACFETGMAKNTYGTGCFLLMNTGSEIKNSPSGLLNTIAWGVDGKITYALEGSVFVGGAAVQWLRDGLQIIDHAKETEAIASTTEDKDVYVVPAFAGLGTPYWDMYSRGAIFGLTRDTGKDHIVKATLESLAYQSKDVLDAMQKDSGIQLKKLQVDGGACANDYLMQFQADLLDVEIERPDLIESTAIGAAYLAAYSIGLWSLDEITEHRKVSKIFYSKQQQSWRDAKSKRWNEAVKRTMNWVDH
ncbi:MAG: glycerol kinase [Polaribacter sp.]|jgi:glycerol kinase